MQIVRGGGFKTTIELFESGEDKGEAAVTLKRKSACVLRRPLVRMRLFPRRLARDAGGYSQGRPYPLGFCRRRGVDRDQGF